MSRSGAGERQSGAVQERETGGSHDARRSREFPIRSDADLDGRFTLLVQAHCLDRIESICIGEALNYGDRRMGRSFHEHRRLAPGESDQKTCRSNFRQSSSDGIQMTPKKNPVVGSAVRVRVPIRHVVRAPNVSAPSIALTQPLQKNGLIALRQRPLSNATARLARQESRTRSA